MTTATARQVWIDSQQIYPDVTYTDAVSGRTAAVSLFHPLDWGAAPIDHYTVPAAVGDGDIYMGTHAGARPFTLNLSGQCPDIPEAYLEAYKDDLHAKMLSWFKPGSRRVTIKSVRYKMTGASSTASVERVLYAKPAAYQSWAIQPGGMGQFHASPVVEYSVPLVAHYPWWLDSTTAGQYKDDTHALTTSSGSLTLTNDGDRAAGFQVRFQCAATATAVSFSVTYGSGLLTFACTTTLSPSSWTVFDFRCADPQKVYMVSGIATSDLLNPTALAAGTSIRGSMTTWPTSEILAEQSTITFAANISAGSGTGTFGASIRRQWGDP